MSMPGNTSLTRAEIIRQFFPTSPYVRHLGKVFDLVTNQSAAVTICEGLEDLALPRIHHSRAVAMPNGTVLPETTARPNTNGQALELLSIGRLVLRAGFN